MQLLIITILLALVAGYLLFKIYNILLSLFLKKMNWELSDLKDYTVTPKVQMYDKIAGFILFIAIVYRVLNT
ncbi:MAG: hypothetical protein HQL32_07395 [Planctomycetes bacterium]|nr:hypothetical protein [Planctomycetota bacterium]